MNIPVLYVFVNSDLPSMSYSVGKIAAHSGHAANAFIHQQFINREDDDVIPQAVREWMSATSQGFGTQINLKGDWEQVVDTVAEYSLEGGMAELIVDPTYPYIVDNEIVNLIDPDLHTVAPRDLGDGRWLCHRRETTAAYVFGYKDELEPWVGMFPLHP